MLTLVVTLEEVKLPPTQIDWLVKSAKTGLVQLQLTLVIITVRSMKQPAELKIRTVYCWLAPLGLAKLLTMTPPTGMVVEPVAKVAEPV